MGSATFSIVKLGRPDYPKSVKDFLKQFSSEQACLKYLVRSRWPEGYRCPRCNHHEHWVLAKRQRFVCRACRYEATPTSGTLMHRSHISLRDWFWAAYTMATMTPGLSALQLQRQIGVRYSTAWFMLQRLRRGMVNGSRSKLNGIIEADESILGGPAKGKRGRGAAKAAHKALVLGAVEIQFYGGTTENSKQRAGRLRLQQVSHADEATIENFLTKNVEPGSVIFTDGWKGYSLSALRKFAHESQPQQMPQNAHQLAPHIHRVFSNLKTWLRGTHHGVEPKYLQNYLDEFTFRFNRRQTPMAAFQTLLGISANKPHLPLNQLKA